jgi:hypothetical protein
MAIEARNAWRSMAPWTRIERVDGSLDPESLRGDGHRATERGRLADASAPSRRGGQAPGRRSTRAGDPPKSDRPRRLGRNSPLAAIIATADGEIFVKGMPSGQRQVITQAREAAVAPLVKEISPALLPGARHTIFRDRPDLAFPAVKAFVAQTRENHPAS